MSRLARDLHPVAWWLWAGGLALAASMTTSPVLLGLFICSAWLVVAARRSDQPWADAFRLYLWLGLAIVVVRVVFRILLSGGADGEVVFSLPTVPLPDWVLGIRLLGPVTRESLLAGLADGMRLATIVICCGAANALANPKRLLKSMPAALYEIGTALVVSITVVPQLADSARRVRAAQALRGGPAGRVARLRRLLVPVLEDAFERSLRLAAGMDARGYGRAGHLTVRQRRQTGTFMVAGLIGIGVGAYAVLDQTAPRVLAGPMLIVGVLLAGIGLWSAGRQVQRTRYRPDPWRWPEVAVVAAGLAAGVILWWVARNDVLAVHPDGSTGVDTLLQLSPWCVVAVGLALVPALVAPPPRQLRSRTPNKAAADLPEAGEAGTLVSLPESPPGTWAREPIR
ncbi:MAG: energy-coupling factor transporter transmembrane component T [Nocardioides sp.]